MKRLVRNEEGFTLIEIIAVLIILGILAAVAVPKFMDLQQSARDKAVWGAIAAVKSQVMMDYASATISNPAEASDWQTLGPAGGSETSFGDFVGNYEMNSTTGMATVTIVASYPNWLTSNSTDTVEVYSN